MKKRFLGLMTAGVMAASMTMPASAANVLFTFDCSRTATNTASNVWASFKDDGVLTISGTGKMDFCKRLFVDYEAEGVSPYPWSSSATGNYDQMIEKLIVKEGVTDIYDFGSLPELKAVYLPNSIEEVSAFDFILCPKLETFFVNPGTTQIGPSKFKHAAENFTIYGYKDTYAEAYAAENAYNFHAMGDLNGDGCLDLGDAADILMAYAQYASDGDAAVDTESTAPNDADVNQDGTINVVDATLTMRYFAQTASNLEVDWLQLLAE